MRPAGVILCLALLSSARAGSAMEPRIEDPAEALTSDQRLTLERDSQSFPVQVIFTSEFSTMDALDRFVSDRMSAADLVVVAVDPANRNTVVHFGRDLRISAARREEIVTAGDSFFQRRDWTGGVDAILTATQRGRGTDEMPVWAIVLITCMAGGLTVAIFGAFRSARVNGRPSDGSPYSDSSWTSSDSGSGDGGHSGGGFDGGGGGSHW